MVSIPVFRFLVGRMEMPDLVRRLDARSPERRLLSEEDYLQGLSDASLIDVNVTDRIIYDVDQLRAFMSSELPADESACSCSCANTNEILARGFARELQGKIWSAHFAATKPAD